jgi:hypothetical protein
VILKEQTAESITRSGISQKKNQLFFFKQKASFYFADTGPEDFCLKSEPREQRGGLTLYTLASGLQKQKAKLNPHMADVTPLATSFPSAM